MHLSLEAWQRRQQDHERRLEPVVRPHLARRARGEKHPVYDFLFEYYSFHPSLLLGWTPGVGVVLEGEAARKFLEDEAFGEISGGIALDRDTFPARRLQAARWILSLLDATAGRPPRFGCFGLHEWAMVYRAGDVRHRQFALRLPPDEIAALVDSQPVGCSHYDAFRFFTPTARPLNRVQLRRETQMDHEQGGCLHANMDLYKWAYKFHPWIASELIADAFLLAMTIRELDMKAGPYDLQSIGVAAIPLETAAGRAEYQRQQAELAGRAQALRLRLREAYRTLLAWSGEPQTACPAPGRTIQCCEY